MSQPLLIFIMHPENNYTVNQLSEFCMMKNICLIFMNIHSFNKYINVVVFINLEYIL